MRTINPHLYALISDALKCSGTYDPKRVLPHFEEHLTRAEFNTLQDFLGWCHKTGKVFGSGNYQQRFAEWRMAAGRV